MTPPSPHNSRVIPSFFHFACQDAQYNMENGMAADVNAFCLFQLFPAIFFLYLTHKDTPRMTHQGSSCPRTLTHTVSSYPNAQFSGQLPSSDTANTQSPSTTSSRIVTPRVCVTSCNENVLTADLLVHPLSRNVAQVLQPHLQAVPIL